MSSQRSHFCASVLKKNCDVKLTCKNVCPDQSVFTILIECKPKNHRTKFHFSMTHISEHKTLDGIGFYDKILVNARAVIMS